MNKKEARYLIPDAPRIPVIYQIPKIYKSRFKPPGRPIVSGIDSLFSRLGEYLDFFLKPLSQEFPVYLKDSKELINLLKKIEITDD